MKIAGLTICYGCYNCERTPGRRRMFQFQHGVTVPGGLVGEFDVSHLLGCAFLLRVRPSGNQTFCGSQGCWKWCFIM